MGQSQTRGFRCIMWAAWYWTAGENGWNENLYCLIRECRSFKYGAPFDVWKISLRILRCALITFLFLIVSTVLFFCSFYSKSCENDQNQNARYSPFFRLKPQMIISILCCKIKWQTYVKCLWYTYSCFGNEVQYVLEW